MSTNATSSDPDASKPVDSDEDLRTDDEDDDDDNLMASELCATANGNEDASTPVRTSDDGDENGNGNEHQSGCSICKVPWCDGRWHTIQRDVMDDIANNFYHPGLAWSAYVARCNFEVEERERRKIAFLAKRSNIRKRTEEENCDGGDTKLEHEQHFAIADQNAK